MTWTMILRTCFQGFQVYTQDRLEFIELSSDVHYLPSCILQVRSRVEAYSHLSHTRGEVWSMYVLQYLCATRN